MDDSICIKQFDMSLYDEVFSLWQSCEGIGLGESDTRENMEKYLQRNPGQSFVAVIDGRIVGAVLSGHDGRRGYLHHLAVAKEHRKQGIGTSLVGKCLKALEDLGIGKCHIFVFSDNESGKAFWQSAGWTVRNDVTLISKDIKPDCTCCC